MLTKEQRRQIYIEEHPKVKQQLLHQFRKKEKRAKAGRNRKEKRLQRDRQILELRKQGKSIREIGEHFGLTHQRIQQISARIPEFKEYKKKVKYPERKVLCAYCKAQIIILRGKMTKKYCSLMCRSENKINRTPKEWRVLHRERHFAYSQTKKGKEAIKRTQDKQIAKDKKNGGIKQKAYGLVQYHIKKGNIVRPKICSDCKSSNVLRIDGHHADYNKPLDLLWLCPPCHSKEHIKIRLAIA